MFLIEQQEQLPKHSQSSVTKGGSASSTIAPMLWDHCRSLEAATVHAMSSAPITGKEVTPCPVFQLVLEVMAQY